MELDLDNLLKVKTKGRDDSQSNYENFPYEPTPYAVFELIFIWHIKLNAR